MDIIQNEKKKNEEYKELEMGSLKTTNSISLNPNNEDRDNSTSISLNTIEEKETTILLNSNLSTIFEDKYNLLILLALYITWGLVFGYFLSAINVLLIKNNASYSSLSTLTLINYPFVLKFLIAPICDNYYIKKIGKRKTYIILPNYFASILIFISSFYVEDWIKNLEVHKITAIGFFIIFCISIQSIAVDAWPPHMLKQQNIRFVGFIASLGQTIGGLFAYNFFIWFHSVEFCNKYIFNEPRKEGLISNFQMAISISIIIFIISFLIHIFKKEEESPQKEFENFKEFFFTIKKLITNPNIRYYIIITLFMGVGLQLIESGYVVILKKGFSQNTLSAIDLVVSILTTFVGVLGSYLAKTQKEYTSILMTYIFTFLFDMIYYFFVCNYDEKFNNSLAIFFYSLEAFTTGTLNTIRFVLFISFVLRIADEKMTAAYVVFLYSVSNLNSSWTSSISLYLLNYFEYYALGGIGFLIAAIFFICNAKKLISMETIEKKLWSISE